MRPTVAMNSPLVNDERLRRGVDILRRERRAQHCPAKAAKYTSPWPSAASVHAVTGRNRPNRTGGASPRPLPLLVRRRGQVATGAQRQRFGDGASPKAWAGGEITSEHRQNGCPGPSGQLSRSEQQRSGRSAQCGRQRGWYRGHVSSLEPAGRRQRGHT
jgi:hypothetical protein